VRVHEHLLSRGDLSQADRHRAQHALALDFLKAGLLDRAEDALLKLEGTPFQAQARLALLGNYERSRDWLLAAQVADKLDQVEQGSFNHRLAHYLCEQAAAQTNRGQLGGAAELLQQAIAKAPDAPRARIDLALLQAKRGHDLQAWQTLKEALINTPAATPLIAHPLATLAQRCDRVAETLGLMKTLYEETPSLDVLDAIVSLSGFDPHSSESARDWYARHLEKEPSLVAATKWIAGEKLEHEQFHPQVQRALDHATKPLLRYRCAACGFEATPHFWHCPGCQTWDSYPARRVEEL
jgi:lipopolysaccharide biosynthesis regulator YciM